MTYQQSSRSKSSSMIAERSITNREKKEEVTATISDTANEELVWESSIRNVVESTGRNAEYVSQTLASSKFRYLGLRRKQLADFMRGLEALGGLVSVGYSQPLFLSMLPAEVRWMVYAALLPATEVSIELTRPIHQRHSVFNTLTPLSLTCFSIATEMNTWFGSIQHQYNFTPTLLFGPLNLHLTTFNITINHSTWSQCSCHIRSLIDDSPLPCTHLLPHPHLPYCPNTLLTSLSQTWDTYHSLLPIKHLRLFLLGEDEPANGNNSHRRIKYNQTAWELITNLPALQEFDAYVGWPMTTQDLRRWNGIDLFLGGDIWVPGGGPTYGMLERKEGVTVRLWYSWRPGQRVRDGKLAMEAQLWRVWPGDGGPVQMFDVRGVDDAEVMGW